jgi:hypothetical protein
MARLMPIPIHDDGRAVLIVTDRDGVTLMGFIADTTLGGYFEHPPSIPECLAFVARHLPSFERILVQKSGDASRVETSIACVEVEIADLAGAGIAKPR